MTVIGRNVTRLKRTVGSDEKPLNQAHWNATQVHLQTKVDREYIIHLLHHFLVFTGLSEANKLLSEMKAQLLPYETECEIRHQSCSPFFCPLQSLAWLVTLRFICSATFPGPSPFFVLHIGSEIWQHKTDSNFWLEFELRLQRKKSILL